MRVTQLTQRKILLFLGLITLSAVVLSVLMLTRDLDWGDDWAGYIMQGQSIARGNMREFVEANAFTIEHSSYVIAPVTYPWGFPLLLSPVLDAFGLNLLALKFVLTICYALFLPAFFLLARTRLSRSQALLLTAVLGLNPALLLMQDGLGADIPFLLFSTLGLWLIEKFVNQDQQPCVRLGPGVAIGCVVFLAIFTRGNGYFLLASLAIAQFMRFMRRARHNVRLHPADLQGVVPYAVVGLLYVLQAWAFPGLPYPLRPLFAVMSLPTIWNNVGYYFWLPADFFGNLVNGGRIIYLVLLIGFLLNLSQWRGRDLPIHAYGLATLLFLVLYPHVQGLRYILPLLPLFVLFSFDGMRRVVERLQPGHRERTMALTFDLWAGLALISLAACIQLGWGNLAADRAFNGRSSGAFSPGSSAMFEFVRQETPPDSVIIFFKPRTMRLRTDRDSFMTSECQDLSTGDYVAILNSEQGYDQIQPDKVTHCNPAVFLVPVYEKYDFIIYRISPLD